MIVSRGFGLDPVTEISSGARAALQASPGYFLGWYTIKSLLLVGATAAFAYYLGKEEGRKARRWP